MLKGIEAPSRVRHLHRKAGCRVGHFWHHRERKQCEITGQVSLLLLFTTAHLATLMLSSTPEWFTHPTDPEIEQVHQLFLRNLSSLQKF